MQTPSNSPTLIDEILHGLSKAEHEETLFGRPEGLENSLVYLRVV